MWHAGDSRASARTPRLHRKRIHLLSLGLVAAVIAVFGSPSQRDGWSPSCAAVASGGAPVSQLADTISLTPDSTKVLQKALRQIDQVAALVHKQGVVPGYGRKAAKILNDAVASNGAGTADADVLKKLVDAKLKALFLQQLQTLVNRAVDRYDLEMEARPNPFEANSVAVSFFDTSVADLVPPDSDWSAEAERKDLDARLEKSYAVDAQLVDEQAKHGKGKQVSMEVIRKLQQQVESVQKTVEHRGAFPWNIRGQYFLDNSPVGFRGQYEKGRGVMELLLMPNPNDPRQKGSLLNKIGPLNMAVVFDMLL